MAFYTMFIYVGITISAVFYRLFFFSNYFYKKLVF